MDDSAEILCRETLDLAKRLRYSQKPTTVPAHSKNVQETPCEDMRTMKSILLVVLILALALLVSIDATCARNDPIAAIEWSLPGSRIWSIYARFLPQDASNLDRNSFRQLFKIYSATTHRLYYLTALQEIVEAHEIGFFREGLTLDPPSEQPLPNRLFKLAIVNLEQVIWLDSFLKFLDENPSASPYDGIIIHRFTPTHGFEVSVFTTRTIEEISSQVSMLNLVNIAESVKFCEKFSKPVALTYSIIPTLGSFPLGHVTISELIDLDEASTTIPSTTIPSTDTSANALLIDSSCKQVLNSPCTVSIVDEYGNLDRLFRVGPCSLCLLEQLEPKLSILIQYEDDEIFGQTMPSTWPRAYITDSMKFSTIAQSLLYLCFKNPALLIKAVGIHTVQTFDNEASTTITIMLDPNASDDAVERCLLEIRSYVGWISLDRYKSRHQFAQFTSYFSESSLKGKAISDEALSLLSIRFDRDVASRRSTEIVLKNSALLIPKDIIRPGFKVSSINTVASSLNCLIHINEFSITAALSVISAFFSPQNYIFFGAFVRQIIISYSAKQDSLENNFIQFSWQLYCKPYDPAFLHIKQAYIFILGFLRFEFNRFHAIDKEHADQLLWISVKDSFKETQFLPSDPTTIQNSIKHVVPKNIAYASLPIPNFKRALHLMNLIDYSLLRHEASWVVCSKFNGSNQCVPLFLLHESLISKESLFPQSLLDDNRSYTYLIYNAKKSYRARPVYQDDEDKSSMVELCAVVKDHDYLLTVLKALVTELLNCVTAVRIAGRPLSWLLVIQVTDRAQFERFNSSLPGPEFRISNTNINAFLKTVRFSAIPSSMSGYIILESNFLLELLETTNGYYFTASKLLTHAAALLTFSNTCLFWSTIPIREMDVSCLITHTVELEEQASDSSFTLNMLADQHVENLATFSKTGIGYAPIYSAIRLSGNKITFFSRPQVLQENHYGYLLAQTVFCKRALFMAEYMDNPSPVPSYDPDIHFIDNYAPNISKVFHSIDQIKSTHFNYLENYISFSLGSNSSNPKMFNILIQAKFAYDPNTFHLVLRELLRLLQIPTLNFPHVFYFRPYLSKVFIARSSENSIRIGWNFSISKEQMSLEISAPVCMSRFLGIFGIKGTVKVISEGRAGKKRIYTVNKTFDFAQSVNLKHVYHTIDGRDDPGKIYNMPSYMYQIGKATAAESQSTTQQSKLIKIKKELQEQFVSLAVEQIKRLSRDLNMVSWAIPWKVYLTSRRGSSYDHPLAMLQLHGQQEFENVAAIEGLIKRTQKIRIDSESLDILPGASLVCLMIRDSKLINWGHPLNSTNLVVWSVPVSSSSAANQLANLFHAISCLASLVIDARSKTSLKERRLTRLLERAVEISRSIVAIERQASKTGVFENADNLAINLLIDKTNIVDFETMVDIADRQVKSCGMKGIFFQLLEHLSQEQ